MKRVYTLIALVLGVFVSSANAQEHFYADEGYDAALSKASEDLSSPGLMLCMAMDMTSAEGIPIPVEFDWDTGKGSMWIYYFVDQQNTEMNSGVVVFSIPVVGIQAIDMDVTEWISELTQYASLSNPIEKSQLNTQSMAATFLADDEFATELAIYQDNANLFVSIFHNESFPGLEAGKKYWGVLFDPELTDKACALALNSQDVECTTITSVEDKDFTEEAQFLSANPVEDILRLKLPNAETQNVEIYDMLGNLVKSYNSKSQDIDINVSELQAGAYFVRINNGTNIQTKKFIKR